MNEYLYTDEMGNRVYRDEDGFLFIGVIGETEEGYLDVIEFIEL